MAEQGVTFVFMYNLPCFVNKNEAFVIFLYPSSLNISVHKNSIPLLIIGSSLVGSNRGTIETVIISSLWLYNHE